MRKTKFVEHFIKLRFKIRTIKRFKNSEWTYPNDKKWTSPLAKKGLKLRREKVSQTLVIILSFYIAISEPSSNTGKLLYNVFSILFKKIFFLSGEIWLNLTILMLF